MGLVEKLNSYSENYWDFADYRENNPVIQYPGKMVIPMQRQLLTDIYEYDDKIRNIMDPFMGSGTVLEIGKELGIDVIGMDINPLAVLISEVRLEGIPSNEIAKSIDQLSSRIVLYLGNTTAYKFNNIDKWFRKDVIESLSILRAAIMDETDERIRKFYWCCFAETVKKYSNTRTSTFKLHVKEKEKIESMSNDCIEEFKRNVRKYYSEYCFERDINIDLKTGNSIQLMSEYPDESVDLICTSPPYGDNHTTVTYGQYSILPLLWIDINDMKTFDESMLNTFTGIDRESLGGKVRGIRVKEEYDCFLRDISFEKKRKINSFWQDYELAFQQMARVLKKGKLLVLTLGNRRVDNHELPFDKFNDYLAQKYGFCLETTLCRNIMGKRMPLKVSHVAEQGAVQSMSKEYIKVYKRK